LALIGSQKVTRVTSRSLFTACAQNVILEHECNQRWTLTPLANSTFSNYITQNGSLSDDVSFQFVDVRS